jgi:hypothetical protein
MKCLYRSLKSLRCCALSMPCLTLNILLKKQFSSALRVTPQSSSHQVSWLLCPRTSCPRHRKTPTSSFWYPCERLKVFSTSKDQLVPRWRRWVPYPRAATSRSSQHLPSWRDRSRLRQPQWTSSLSHWFWHDRLCI